MKYAWIICLFLSFTFLEWPIQAESLFLNRGPQNGAMDTTIPDNLKEDLHYFLVHFKGPIFESQKEKIRSLGGTILSYIPLNTFIIRMSPQTKKKIESLSFIESIGFFKQSYRLSAQVKPTSIFNIEEDIKLVVEFFPGEDLTPILKKLQKNGAHIEEISENIIRVSGTRNALFFLEYLKEVSWIEEDIEFGVDTIFESAPSSPFDELTGFESGHKLIDSHLFHDLGFKGETQIIGFSDTGLDVGIDNETLHGDFIGKIHSAYVFEGSDWKDTWGHGTHVAGLLAGGGKLSDGKMRASAFGAKLIVQSLINAGRFRVPLKIGEVLLEPAYRDGARIHSNSWGSKVRFGTYSPYCKSVDQFIWDHSDMLVLFASGNTAGDYDKDGFVDEGSILIPGTAKNVLTVGASENIVTKGGVQLNWQPIGAKEEKWQINPIASDFPSDHENGIAAFSSRGPTRDGRIKPDMVAPGTNILSTRSHIPESKDLWGIYNADYIWNGGSSMSAPIVASGMALVREYLINQKKALTPSSALLKALAINSAIELFPGQFGDIDKKEIPKRRPNVQEGWGRINVARAALETEKRKILHYDETLGLATSEEKEYSFIIIYEEEPMAATLVYHDFPSALSTTKYLVNDLDLEVMDSLGNVYFPNGFSKKDDTNNVEGVDILKPSKGEFKVKIKGFNIPQGKDGRQPFALVVSGGIIEKKW